MIKKAAQKIYVGLIFIFLYAPIFTLIVLSFNASKTRSKWGGFTFKWYIELFQNESILKALGNTLTIAFLSALIATIIGTITCIGFQYVKKRNRTLMLGIANIPMLNAEIVTGISLMLLFISLGVKFGFMTILLAHITFNIPYVILSVLPRMKQLNPHTYEAALDLGCTHIQAFFKITFPDLLPGILSGFLMAFTMSLDDFIITHFTKGPGIDTLSTKIYTEVKKGIKPEMYALSTLIFIAVLLLLFFANYIPKKKSAKATAIISYLTAFGLFIALISGDKKGAKFHINQAFAIYLLSLLGLLFLFSGFNILAFIWTLLMLVAWLLGLISAIIGINRPLPIIGNIRILK